MNASTRARVLLLQRCSRACDGLAKPPAPVSRLADGRTWASSRPLAPVGGSLTHARCRSSVGSSSLQHGGESSETEGSSSPLASETSGGSEAVSPDGSAVPNFAFAFDIDGVLLHSSKAIPGAAETLRYLQRDKIPFILLTNGGGKSEAERVADLSSKLGVDLDTSNFVQSHTPYQELARFSAETWDLEPANPNPNPKKRTPVDLEPGHKLRQAVIRSGVPWYLREKVGVTEMSQSTVLVLGSDAARARRIAQGYGFKSVVTPGDILKACPEIFPFDPLSEFYDKQETLPLPKPLYSPARDAALEDCLKIDMILVFNDPRDWAVDMQLVMDLLFSHRGYLGTFSTKDPEEAAARGARFAALQADGQPALVFSNRDFLWSSGYHLSRLGQGAFREAVHANFHTMAARILQRRTKDQRIPAIKTFSFGKPMATTYQYAQQVLLEHHGELWRQRQQQHQEHQQQPSSHPEQRAPWPAAPRLQTIYMVGDNPESDIHGANGMAASRHRAKETVPLWMGCLVKTGVWSEATSPLDKLTPLWRPQAVHDDVKATVNWALKQHGWPGAVE